MYKKIAFHNLGCKVNSYELEYVVQRFKENDFEIVPFDQKADIFVINTCTVTNIADRKTRQMIHRARKLNENAVIAAMGCYAETNNDAVSDESIDILIGNNDKGRAYEIITDYISLLKKNEPMPPKNALPDISKVRKYDDYKLTAPSGHTRVYIKIQDGCNQFCSYCAIPLARGRIRSRKMESIIDEITELSDKGYKEFVLTGIHLSSYGTDIDTSLIDAVERAAEINNVQRIRLGSLEPRIITDDFLKRLKKINKICPHFHLSLQSGSDSVLKRMNRHYTADEFYKKVMLIRQYFDHPAITTDVIAGFPGETDEEFKQTRSFLNKCDFYEAHVFKYSRRKGTAADKLNGQLSEKEKTERSSLLICDSEKRSDTFRQYYVGKSADVLFEEIVTIGNEQYLTGYTREYVKTFHRGCNPDMLNTIRICTFSECTPYGLIS